VRVGQRHPASRADHPRHAAGRLGPGFTPWPWGERIPRRLAARRSSRLTALAEERQYALEILMNSR
jgi:hypothetical protein